MFNFKSLNLVKRCDFETKSSFVGIRRDKNNKLEFCLPHGFDEFPVDDFEQTKRLFFKMYSTFRKFERDSTRDILDKDPVHKDNTTTQGNGYRFKDKEDTEVILYSKIALIENLLEAYRDLSLDVMERRIGQDERVDYSKMEHYLHRAIYLPNDVIFIDEMDLPRQTLRYEAMVLIDLFCFILSELQTELEQDTELRVKELAHRFSEQHLNHDQSLFNEETFEITILTLKDVLDEVDKRTTYKDDDYWRLYEAIELFLYGELDMDGPHEDGTYWGIDNFSSVWEDMCNTYAFANFDVLYADSNIVFNGERVANYSTGYHRLFKKESFENPFFIKFREQKRWMRPDLVHYLEDDDQSFFKKSIRINITNRHAGRLDFNITLIDKSKKIIYQALCHNLQHALNSGRKGSKRIHGARVIGKNNFKNYPESELQNNKNFIEEAYNGKKFFSYVILDWKYIDNYETENKKLNADITKQICYESTLQQYKSITETENQFVIPYFYNIYLKPKDEIGCFVDKNRLYKRLVDNKIKVFKANFQLIQAVYLNHD